jgi:TonB family protein
MTRLALTLAAALTLVGAPGGPASAQTPAPPAPPSHPDDITNPDWETKPEGDALVGLYPSWAFDHAVEGRVMMQCDVQVDGAMANCVIVEEHPLGYGFGRATLQAQSYFRMHPRTINGLPVGGARVDIPMNWRLEAPRRHELVVETPNVTTPPSAEREPEADYPEPVQGRGEQGVVWVRAKLDRTGATRAITIRDSSRSPTLDQAAAAALAGWRFKPAENAAGRPVAATIAVKFEFEMVDVPAMTCAGLTAQTGWIAKAWPERKVADFPVYAASRAYASTYDRNWLKYGGESAFDQRFATAFDRARADCATKPAARFVDVLGEAFTDPPG